jgi:organic radical activating enzyme
MSSQHLVKTKGIIDSISTSFCAAKWYNVSIWLGNGRTASCHHPLAHSIPRTELDNNPSALHNTQFKKEQRKLMLNGERPAECSYCWRVEDAAKKDSGIFSDRVYQTQRYTEEEINAIKNMPWDANVIPKTVELAFDNLCNLACSYCNAEFSSTWHQDISRKGPYENMKTSGGHTFKNTGHHAMPYGSKNQRNPYIEKFYTWFEEIRGGLQELRVSGGEPARSPSFWQLLEMCNNETFDFAVNSNLIMDDERIETLINAAKNFKSFDVYTSAESIGKHGEFVRDGFEWDTWERNLFKLHESPNIRSVHIMMTISALSVWTIDQFMDKIINWRKRFSQKEEFFMSVNILRFPSFQSINIIDKENKLMIADKIESALNRNREYMIGWEANQYERVITYLRDVDKSYEDTDVIENKHHDFKNFIEQYSVRREMPLDEYLPTEFLNWFNTLKKDE